MDDESRRVYMTKSEYTKERVRVLCPTPACGDGAAGCRAVLAGAGYKSVPAGNTKVYDEFYSGGFSSLFFGKLVRT